MQFSHKSVTFAQVFKDTTRFQEFVTLGEAHHRLSFFTHIGYGPSHTGNLVEGSPGTIRTMVGETGGETHGNIRC